MVMTIIELINLRFFFKRTEAAQLQRYPSVSVIKALKGVDAQLVEDLESFCAIDYPNFEIILAVASLDDPVIPLIRAFLSRPGASNVRLVVDPSALGDNPKVSNLHNGVKASTGEILIFSDSDTRAAPDLIRRLIGPLEDRRTGITSAVAVFRGGRGFWARAKAVTYNSTVTLYDALWCKFIPVAVGGAMAVRRHVFEEVGGFQPVADMLTDDQEMGKLVGRHGYKVAYIPHLIAVCEEPLPFPDLMRQILRWLVAIKAAAPFDYQFILLTNTVFLAFVFWLLAPASLFHVSVFAAVLVFRIWTPFHLYRRYLRDPGTARDAWMIVPMDFVLTTLWTIGQWKRRVTWRGAKFVLRKGKMYPVRDGRE
jgi:ceramide glucosyltransferase